MEIHLTDSEWIVMEVLWKDSPLTMMQITRELVTDTGWTKHTVMSFLKRMEDKGALTHEEGQRAKLYYPSLPREAAVMYETQVFLDKIVDGQVEEMIDILKRLL